MKRLLRRSLEVVLSTAIIVVCSIVMAIVTVIALALAVILIIIELFERIATHENKDRNRLTPRAF